MTCCNGSAPRWVKTSTPRSWVWPAGRYAPRSPTAIRRAMCFAWATRCTVTPRPTAWELAFVLEGRAGERLLASYSAERQPVGAAGVARAITSLHESSAIETALGLQPGQSAEDGWKALNVLYEPGVAGDERRRALREAIELSNYQFNAHGIAMGYVYHSDVITAEPTPAPVPARDPVLYYTPPTRPGARVPHARLERDGQPLSSLDLVDPQGCTLLTGVFGNRWQTSAEPIATRVCVPITVHVIGDRGGLHDPYRGCASRSE